MKIENANKFSRTLQMALERESHKRDHEKETLELKILQLREVLRHPKEPNQRNVSPNKIKAKYEERLAALARHVEIHQKLNNRFGIAPRVPLFVLLPTWAEHVPLVAAGRTSSSR